MKDDEKKLKPVTLWSFLKNKTINNYEWVKEERDFGNCYVCFYEAREIGFIPIEHCDKDLEWVNWWKIAYKRYPDGLTISILMDEIMNRHVGLK